MPDITWPGIAKNKGELSPCVNPGIYRVSVAEVKPGKVEVKNLEDAKEMWAAQDGIVEYNIQFKILPDEENEGFPFYKRFKIPFVLENDELVPKQELFDKYDWLCEQMQSEIAALYIACGCKLESDTFNPAQLQGERLAVEVSKQPKMKNGVEVKNQFTNQVENFFSLDAAGQDTTEW